jgi:hypothetical protein
VSSEASFGGFGGEPLTFNWVGWQVWVSARMSGGGGGQGW